MKVLIILLIIIAGLLITMIGLAMVGIFAIYSMGKYLDNHRGL